MKIQLKSHAGCKTVLLNLALLTTIGTATAIVTFSFSNWDTLKQRSPDIVIARCAKTPSLLETLPNGTVVYRLGNVFEADMKIIYALRGRTNLGPARLSTWYRPLQGEEYLIFSIYHDGFYQAIERYRIVPLGMDFPKDMLAGKSFDEQIRALLQYRLNMLNREIDQAQEEKKRLEEGLKP